MSRESMSKFNSPSKFFALVSTLGLKSLRLRYRNSLLGYLWSLLNPLIYLLIFSVVFSNVFNEIDRYPLFVLCGLIIWIFFSTTSIQIIESVTASRQIMKSLRIPASAFPLSALYAGILSLLLMMVPFLLIMFRFGMKFGPEFILVIPLLVLMAAFTFGLSLILTAVNVYFRDVQLAWTTFLPAIFYVTPIAYAPKLIPAGYEWLLKLNPLYYFVESLRAILYSNLVPDMSYWIAMIVISTVSLIMGLLVFRKLQGGFISQF